MKRFMASLVSLSCGLALAMGSPPQKPARTAGKPTGSLSVMLKDEDLKASPDISAKALGHIAKGTSVRVLASQGGWTQIAGNGQTGWVRVLSVRAPSSSQAGADLAGLVEAGASPRDSGKVVAVAGVRGLDEETLKSATFSPSEIQLLEGYALGRTEAEQFAQAAGLRARSLPGLVIAEPAAHAEPVNGQ